MTAVKVALPGQRTPLVDSNGMVTSPWYQFFQGSHNRTGGNPVDKVEEAAQVGATATTAAATANTAAATANAAAAAAQTAADNAQSAADGTSSFQSLLNSGVDQDCTLTGQDAGANGDVVISNSTRFYADGTSVAVTGAALTSLAYDTYYFIYYDDPSRAGGAVIYHATTNDGDAQPSSMNPNRHYMGKVKTPVMGDPDTTGNPNFYAP